jgi:hypothetical protein
MIIQNAIVVALGAVILLVGLFYSLKIIAILRNFNLAQPWIVLFSLTSFFLFGYIFTALRFLNINLLPGVSLEDLVTAIFFFGAIFVMILAILNLNLFASIFGIGLSDSKAIRRFSEFVKIPAQEIIAKIKPGYSVRCEICNQAVKYSIPDIVRAHPRLERGVIVEKAMGGINYRFFVRHYCNNEFREIPVRHDSNFEFRSHGPSRLV